MKMSELRAENESLKQQIQLLSQQPAVDHDSAEVAQLKDKNRGLRKSVKDLKAEKTALSAKVHALEDERSSSLQEQQSLKTGLEHIQQQLAELSNVHAATTAELESLRLDQAALIEKASQLPPLQAELDRLQDVDHLFGEKTAQVSALQAALEQRSHQLDEANAAASRAAAEHQDQQVRSRREMELVRSNLQGELASQREQSSSEIAALQSNKEALSAKVTDLTEKLKLVATHLERQLREKQKIAYQYETSVKENQAFKDKSEKQIQDLMALLHKMGAELDASRAAHPTPEASPFPLDGAKPASAVVVPAAVNSAQPKLEDLLIRLGELDQINATQAGELVVLKTSLKRIHKAFSTPFGRVASKMLGL